MDGICKLCSEEKTLKESHIVPSFIFKWIKETSVTGFLRSGGNMNQRIQDGYKQYLLCHECEQKFSTYETYFAQHFFYPSTQSIKKSYTYDEKLHKFVASLIWRIVVINLDREVYKSSPFVAKMYAYEKALKGFLSVDKPIDNDGEFYISFTHLTLDVPKSLKSANFYFTRMAESQMMFNKEVAFVYCKLSKRAKLNDIKYFSGMSRKEKHIELTETEHFTLREGSKYHPKPEFRIKCQGLLLNHTGMRFKAIATHLGVNHNTVGNWVRAWETMGIAGLCRKNGQGRKLILSVSNTVHTDLLDKTVETHRQNVRAIRAELVKELATPMSTDTVKRFLKKIITVGDESVDVPMKVRTKKRI